MCDILTYRLIHICIYILASYYRIQAGLDLFHRNITKSWRNPMNIALHCTTEMTTALFCKLNGAYYTLSGR